jgi:hypothetical protein
MKIEVAIGELKGVRVAIAFPPPAWVAPGVGDTLLERLKPHFPALPLMLAAHRRRPGTAPRVHAAFQAQALSEGIDLDVFPRRTVDLDLPPPAPDRPAPF